MRHRTDAAALAAYCRILTEELDLKTYPRFPMAVLAAQARRAQSAVPNQLRAVALSPSDIDALDAALAPAPRTPPLQVN